MFTAERLWDLFVNFYNLFLYFMTILDKNIASYIDTILNDIVSFIESFISYIIGYDVNFPWNFEIANFVEISAWDLLFSFSIELVLSLIVLTILMKFIDWIIQVIAFIIDIFS